MLYYDAANEGLWIGTHMGGLNRLHIANGQITTYRTQAGNPYSLPSDIVRDIIPCGKQLVIATQTGICLFNPTNEQCELLPIQTHDGRPIKTVTSIAIDREGVLWIAAIGEGVYRYRFDTKQVTNYRHNPDRPGSLSNNTVNNILCDSRGTLWFSTSGSGLDCYRPLTDDFENFDQRQNGLLNDCVYRAEESTMRNKLLLITNGGFSIFDLTSKQFTNYSHHSGFPLSSINENSLCVTRDGEVFLGSTQGMISFYETQLDFCSKPYHILLTRLLVNGKEIRVNDESEILQEALEYTSSITLNAGQSMFSIEFATNNFITSNEDEIIYKLEGFSGSDPEVSTRAGVLTPGFDWSAYPRSFNASLGINLNF